MKNISLGTQIRNQNLTTFLLLSIIAYLIYFEYTKSNKTNSNGAIKRIVHVSHANLYAKRGGGETLIQNIALLLGSRGFDVTFYHREPLVLFSDLKAKIKTKVFFSNVSAATKWKRCMFNYLSMFLYRQQQNRNVAIEYKGFVCYDPYIPKTVTRIVLDSTRPKLILRRFQILFGRQTKFSNNPIYKTFSKLILRFVSGINSFGDPVLTILPSHYDTRQQPKSNLPPITKAPFFAWKKQQVKLLKVKDNGEKFIFSLVSRYIRWKKIELTIEAFDLIYKLNSQERFKFQLNIIGVVNEDIDDNAIYAEELEEMIIRKNLSHVIKMHYHTADNDKEIRALRDKTDALIHTALTECRAVVFYESMVKGAPVISFNSAGNRETTVEGVNGLMASPLTTNALAEKIIEFMENYDLRVNMSARASFSMINTYTEDDYFDSIKKHLYV